VSSAPTLRPERAWNLPLRERGEHRRARVRGAKTHGTVASPVVVNQRAIRASSAATTRLHSEFRATGHHRLIGRPFRTLLKSVTL
jgi:hypothetical protein